MDCSICLDSINENQKTVECGHTFHKDCILKWTDNFNWLCPLCRNQTFVLRRLKRIVNEDGIFYPVIFAGEEYIVKDKDFFEVVGKLDLIETDDKEYKELLTTLILFSIIRSSNLDEATEKVKRFFNMN